MAEYQFMEPFDIDDGQLEGLRLIDAFTLGVEWQMVFAALESGESFSRPIHRRNVERIQRMCIRRRRPFRVLPENDEWATLVVAPAEGDADAS